MSYKVRVRPTMIISSRMSNKRSTDTNYRKVPTRRDPDGKLSPNARRKLKHAMRWLIASSDVKQCYEKKRKGMVDWKINLATFTFKKNMQDDHKARVLFSKWLEMAKYRFSVEHYVWKAEPQERGAIHFHLATGRYLPHAEVCYTWNRLLAKEGFPQHNANSTDVHAVHSVESLEAYLSAYLMDDSKHEGRRMIKGKLWGCSHGLSQAGQLYNYIDDDDAAALRYELATYSLQNKLDNPPKFLEFNDVFVGIDGLWSGGENNELQKLYRRELELLKPKLKQKQLFPV